MFSFWMDDLKFTRFKETFHHRLKLTRIIEKQGEVVGHNIVYCSKVSVDVHL